MGGTVGQTIVPAGQRNLIPVSVILEEGKFADDKLKIM
jgi:hypothetical protein